MDSVKDLTSFLKTRQNGASMSELKEVFSDEKELKKFIQLGLENEIIFKDGEKRGTRYYAIGMSKSTVSPKNTENKKSSKQNDDESTQSIECSGWADIDVYLNSDKPINGQGVFSRCDLIGTNNIKKPIEFLNSYKKIETVYIQYDKQSKKNVIIQREITTLNNKIAFKRNGRSYELIFFRADNSSFTHEECGGYEELREKIRSMLK